MRPMFNVTEFQYTINVQMNDAMRALLIDFINDVEQNDLEAELRAFRNALNDPDGALERKLKSNSSSSRRQGGYRDDYNNRRYTNGYGNDRDYSYNRKPDHRKTDQYDNYEEQDA